MVRWAGRCWILTAKMDTKSLAYREQFDLTKPEDFDRIIDQIEPDAILNAAAYTAVDKAEDESELAYQVNAVAPAVMATVAEKWSAFLFICQPTMCLMVRKVRPILEKTSSTR